LPSPLPQFRILREDEAIKISNSLKTAGHLYKKQLENRLSKPPIFNDAAKKKVCDIFLSRAFGASSDTELFKNHRSTIRFQGHRIATCLYRTPMGSRV
jgi:hypothetical protein